MSSIPVDCSLAQPQALCHRPLGQPLTRSRNTSRIFRIDNLSAWHRRSPAPWQRIATTYG
jgi:hypothetical protein